MGHRRALDCTAVVIHSAACLRGLLSFALIALTPRPSLSNRALPSGRTELCRQKNSISLSGRPYFACIITIGFGDVEKFSVPQTKKHKRYLNIERRQDEPYFSSSIPEINEPNIITTVTSQMFLLFGRKKCTIHFMFSLLTPLPRVLFPLLFNYQSASNAIKAHCILTAPVIDI